MGCFEEADILREKYERLLKNGEITPIFDVPKEKGMTDKEMQDNVEVKQEPVPPSSTQPKVYPKPSQP